MRYVVLAIVMLAADARADNADALKQQGVAAAQHGDWELARQRFEQSYALEPRPLTLYNLAAAQEHTDKLVAARASYEAFLKKTAKGEHDKFRKFAAEAIAKLDQAIPRIRIRSTGFAAGTAVRLDGRALAASELAGDIAVDPGDHTVTVVRGSDTVARSAVRLARGVHEDVALVAPPPPVPVPAPPATTPAPTEPARAPEKPHAERSVLASPWLWAIAGAIVVGTVAGVGYYEYRQPGDPTKGTLGPGVLQIP
jgi:hypothetical protein